MINLRHNLGGTVQLSVFLSVCLTDSVCLSFRLSVRSLLSLIFFYNIGRWHINVQDSNRTDSKYYRFDLISIFNLCSSLTNLSTNQSPRVEITPNLDLQILSLEAFIKWKLDHTWISEDILSPVSEYSKISYLIFWGEKFNICLLVGIKVERQVVKF